MSNTYGFSLFASIFIYLKVSFLGLVFIGAPIVIGLGKLGTPTSVNLALLILFALCSFGFFGYGFYIAPERLKFYVCERGLLFRKGDALREYRVQYEQIMRIQLGDEKPGKKLRRKKHRMMLKIECHGEKPIKLIAFTARYKRKSIDQMLALLNEVSGFDVIRGNAQFGRG